MAAILKRTFASHDAPAEELRIVAGLRSGDSERYARLVRRYGPPMLAVARRLMGNEEDARECLQAAFVQAFRHIDAFEHRASLATWLHRIIVNAALTRLRARERRSETALEELMPRFDADGWRIEPQVEGHPSAEMALENADARALMRRTIDALPEGYRNLILLRDVEGYSTEETAALLGLAPVAVKTGLHRARTALKSLLDSTVPNEK